ncbi:MAG: hypothetical protein H7067_13955 [Burkholderiales bacterium]|nr:hypothetical protein [Opitutaceae bacterium]
MKPFSALSALTLALGLSLLFIAPAVASAAGGGKSSRQHEQAKEAKLAADKAVEEKAEAKAAKIQAGEKPAEDTEKKKVWNHRAVRHKQTMPAAPTPADSAK